MNEKRFLFETHPSFQNRITQVLISLGLVVALTLILISVRNSLALAIVVLLYMLPVGLSVSRWGMSAGIVSSLASFFLINYFFIKPYGTFNVHNPQDILVLFAFLFLSFSISRLVGRMENGLAQARARENETARLYDLSLSLSRLIDEADIVDCLARFTIETFPARHVEVYTQTESGSILVSLPKMTDPLPPTVVVSLQGAQHLLGEIRLWQTENRSLGASEKRLLDAFSTQGVLALERARLASAEARAKILGESDKMKAALLSSVSHELRTPLATIKASASSLNSADINLDADARADLLLAIEEEADRLNQLVGNLLSMSRIEAGALKMQPQWNVLVEIISSAVKKKRAQNKNHLLEVNIPEDLPLVFCDDILIEQVFMNLIDNSQKYSPDHSLIVISASETEKNIQVQVQNHSPSIAEADLNRIFEKFHRVTAADQITGTGLGLSICKGIIEAHQGSIWAKNLPKGFAIEFRIPINPAGDPPKISESSL